ncbi:MAG: amidohydrolase [Chloroflexota bacterium]
MASAPDLIITGAAVETLADPGAAARAAAAGVAVRGGILEAVARDDELRAMVGPGTRLIELRGQTLLPGFVDAHIHAVQGGLLYAHCDLNALPDAAAYLAEVTRFAAAHPERSWIEGAGWAMPAFTGGNPHREELDRAIPDRPVFLESRDGHSAWVNARALEAAGIGPGTPDPPDGRIERDADGSPTGTLHEGAVELLRRLLPSPGPDELREALLAAQRYLHALGLTAWQDAYVPPAELAAYRAAAEAGTLTARVVAAQAWDTARGLEQIDELAARREASRTQPNRLRADSVKFFVDGIIENGTALMTEPYLDLDGRLTANRGLPMVDPELLRAAVQELDRIGFQCHFHAIGDGAIRLALDCVAAARMANGRSDRRHHIAHLELINPADIARFAGLEVVANIQPIWATYDRQMLDLRIPVLGPGRVGWQYAFASLERSGARLAGGSDWTVSTPNPLLEVEAAMSRVDVDTRDAEPFLPDQRLSLDTALRAYTIGSAFVNHRDETTGTIEVGKQADLVILDRDLRADARKPVGDARVLATFVAGVEVYRAEEDW